LINTYFTLSLASGLDFWERDWGGRPGTSTKQIKPIDIIDTFASKKSQKVSLYF
jgi:hypothetical protein